MKGTVAGEMLHLPLFGACSPGLLRRNRRAGQPCVAVEPCSRLVKMPLTRGNLACHNKFNLRKIQNLHNNTQPQLLYF